MSHHLVIPELHSLEQLALHETARELWKNLVLQHPGQISSLCLGYNNFAEDDLYKDRILKALPRFLSPRFPNLLKDKLVDAMIDIRLCMEAANMWKDKYRGFLKLSPDIIDYGSKDEILQNFLYSTGSSNIAKYETINFIKFLGTFDDLSWVKLFVADERQFLKSRFYLACMYCFEEEIHSLWCTIKASNQTFSEDDMEKIRDNTQSSIIKLWISRLEGKTSDTFYVDGWKLAFKNFNEHGAYYFWRHCSDDEKGQILLEINWNDLYYASCFRRNGFVHFIYTLLPVELKYNLTSVDIEDAKGVNILVCLLCSSYYKSVLYDILAYPHSVPLKYYTYLLETLAISLEECPMILHKEIFKILINRLPKDECINILSSSSILNFLILINDFDLFEAIVLPLPHWLKTELLLNGVPVDFPMDFFCTKYYEGLVRYLLFLILDYDTVSKKLALRSDAEELLDLFIKHTRTICEFRIFKKTIGFLKDSLPVVDELINRMDYATITHDFLAREIYPLFSANSLTFGESEEMEVDATSL